MATAVSTRDRTWTASNTRRLLATLLCGDLDFHDSASNYASHSVHAFAAKFPPQLPRIFIEALTNPGETVLDPMMGSGTAIVEAFLRSRRAVGFDLDPLALMICSVKTKPVDFLQACWASQKVSAVAHSLTERSSRLDEAMARRYDAKSREFLNYWFSKESQRQLMALLLAIEREKADERLDAFLKVAFSSIIITKSGGVSLAYDLAHTRPHKVTGKPLKNAITVFEQRSRKLADLLCQLPRNGKDVLIARHDCRKALPLTPGSVQLIVTSPPYANAIDYMRAHKFSLVWLGQNITSLGELRGQYIGAEKTTGADSDQLPQKVRHIIARVEASDPKKAKVLTKYFQDMKAAIGRMYQVLETGRACIIVVGNSTMRGIDIPTQDCLGWIAEGTGFELVGITPRKLDRDRRMMPVGFLRNHNSQIETRMHEEYVIGLVKSERG